MDLKFHTSEAKGLKLKVKKFWSLIVKFAEVTGEKLVGGSAHLLQNSSWKKTEAFDTQP